MSTSTPPKPTIRIEHAVTTNQECALTPRTLTVTVRAAFFVPTKWLPPLAIPPAPPVRGCETWVRSIDRHKVLGVTFELSEKLVGDGPVHFPKPGVLEGIKTKRGLDTGLAGLVVHWDRASAWTRKSTPARSDGNRHVGEAKLPLCVEPGDYVLKIIPPPQYTSASSEPAGPDTPVRGFDYLFRPLHVRLTFRDDGLKGAETCVIGEDGKAHAQTTVVLPDGKGPDGKPKTRMVKRSITHGYVTAFVEDELAIDLKPDVIEGTTLTVTDPAHVRLHERARGQVIDMVVLHRTTGALIGSTVNTMLDTWKDSHHYEVDRDGHVLKLVPEDFNAFHAATSHFYMHERPSGTVDGWADSVNARSVGIEIANETYTSFPDAQMVGLIDLLTRLRDKYDIKPHRFVGHCDVYVDDGLAMHDGRVRCPGRELDWPRLERAGFGLPWAPSTLAATDYEGFFELTPEELDAAVKSPTVRRPAIIVGDLDDKRTWGGVDWNTAPAKAVVRSLAFKGIIRLLQADLKIIGYSVAENGEFDLQMQKAVTHFVARTFSGPRTHVKGLRDAVDMALRKMPGSKFQADPMLPGPGDGIPEGDLVGVTAPVTRFLAAYIKAAAETVRKLPSGQ